MQLVNKTRYVESREDTFISENRGKKQRTSGIHRYKKEFGKFNEKKLKFLKEKERHTHTQKNGN